MGGVRLKVIVFFVFFLVLVLPVHAATLQGTIYDTNLDVVENVIVTISTSPQQRLLSTDGTYSFDVPEGAYDIIALYTENGRNQTSTEELIVQQEGTFTYDLFLLPDINFNEDALEDPDELLDYYAPESELTQQEKIINIFTRLIIVVLLLVFGFFAWKLLKKNVVPEEDETAQQVLEFLKKNGGRATQKELRKAIPMSEAKISLVITDLEARDKLEKIKKGRANIVKLKK